MIRNIAADKPAFFADFGTTATTAAGVEITGVFDNAYLDVLNVQCTSPSLLCTAEDAELLPSATALEVGGLNYRVTRQEADIAGQMVRVILERLDG